MKRLGFWRVSDLTLHFGYRVIYVQSNKGFFAKILAVISAHKFRLANMFKVNLVLLYRLGRCPCVRVLIIKRVAYLQHDDTHAGVEVMFQKSWGKPQEIVSNLPPGERAVATCINM